MANFSFRELVEAYRKGIIAKSIFEKKLYDYLDEVFSETLAYNQTKGFNSSKSTAATLHDKKMLTSLVERISLSVFSNPDAFYSATDKYKEINEIVGMGTDSYEIFHCQEQKIVLGSVRSEDSRKNVKISIGVESGTVFVDVIGKKKDRYTEELMVSTYALAEKDRVEVVDKIEGKAFSVNGNYVENAVICNRFDPSHMQLSSTKGVDKNADIHPNKFEKGGVVDQIELALYEYYFKRNAPCPHYHYFQKSVCYNLNKNSASFAININDLTRYLCDLEKAYNSKDKKNPLLVYDLGMPYLDIIQGQIACDMGDFIKTAKTVFQKYYGGDRCKGITLLYDLIDCTRRGDIAGGLALGSEIISFVNDNPPMEQHKTDRYEMYLTPVVDREKTLMLTTALADAFMAVPGEKVDAKQLLKNKQKDVEQTEEQTSRFRYVMKKIDNPVVYTDEDDEENQNKC